jgi:hypothetical protein
LAILTIGHPARIAIIQSIKSKQLCCGYRKRITSRSAHGIPTLKGIKKCRTYQGSFEGNAICYTLDEEASIKYRLFNK